MTRVTTIAGTGCSLLDSIYSHVDFGGAAFEKYRSKHDSDGGLSPGKLVFVEDIERFSGKPFSRVLAEVVGESRPDAINLGGPAIVALVNAAQLLHDQNVRVAFYGAAGDDEAGDRIFSILRTTPVRCDDYIRVRAATPSTTVFYDPAFGGGHGERAFVNTIGAAWKYTPRSLHDSFFSADIALFGATALVPRIHEGLTRLLHRAKAAGCITVVATVYDFLNQRKNPAGRWPLGESDESYRQIDLLIADREEALRLSGAAEIPEAIRFFAHAGTRSCIVTDGAGPVHLFASEGLFSDLPYDTLPVFPGIGKQMAGHSQEEGDTVGCGDNFVGGVLASLAGQMAGRPRSLDVREACIWGIASGGFSCMYKGGTYLEREHGEKAACVRRYHELWVRAAQPPD